MSGLSCPKYVEKEEHRRHDDAHPWLAITDLDLGRYAEPASMKVPPVAELSGRPWRCGATLSLP